MKTFSDFLLVIAAIACMAMSALGFSVGVWNGFWSGTGFSAILHFLLWFLPASSFFAFVSYLVSKPLGLIFAWGIVLGGVITSICGLCAGVSTRFALLFPLIQLIACLALQGDARIQMKAAQAPRL